MTSKSPEFESAIERHPQAADSSPRSLPSVDSVAKALSQAAPSSFQSDADPRLVNLMRLIREFESTLSDNEAVAASGIGAGNSSPLLLQDAGIRGDLFAFSCRNAGRPNEFAIVHFASLNIRLCGVPIVEGKRRPVGYLNLS